MADKDQIKVQRTYRTFGGKLYYVQDLHGQKVTVNEVGFLERMDISLGRFASRVESEVPNK